MVDASKRYLLLMIAIIIIFVVGYFTCLVINDSKLKTIYFVSQKELIKLERARVGDHGQLFDGKIDIATKILFNEVRLFQNQSKILVIVDSTAMEGDDLTPEFHLKILGQLLKLK